MKQFRQVFRMGPGYVFRIPLPGHRFVSAEIFDSEEDAAFYCDVFKSYLVSTFRLTGPTMTPSLAPSRYSTMLSEAGVEPGDVLPLVPKSCIEYLELAGAETLQEYVKAQAEIKSARR